MKVQKSNAFFVINLLMIKNEYNYLDLYMAHIVKQIKKKFHNLNNIHILSMSSVHYDHQIFTLQILIILLLAQYIKKFNGVKILVVVYGSFFIFILLEKNYY